MSDTALRLYLMNLVQYLKYPDGRKIMSEVCCSGLDFFFVGLMHIFSCSCLVFQKSFEP